MDLSGSMQGAGGVGGVGGLLSVTEHSGGSASHYYPTYDGNGNVSEYLDNLNAVQAHYEYDAFGNTVSSSGTKVADFAHRFSTKYYDAETGLYYYGYRYYDPQTGRWPSRDPLAGKSFFSKYTEEKSQVEIDKLKENTHQNIYAFANNDGVNSLDLLGLALLHGLIEVNENCKGMDLSGLSYLSEEEPEDENGNEGAKVFRRLPAPGKEVQADAIYFGNGKAWKIPNLTTVSVSCDCKKKKITFRSRSGQLLTIIGGGVTPWKRGDDPPPRWPTGATDADDPFAPYNGNPPVQPQPPLNPRTSEKPGTDGGNGL